VSAARFVLGHDVGTSGDKAVLCDLEGRTVATSYRPYPLDRPRSGWAEQEPERLLAAVLDTSLELVAGAGLTGADVLAVGVSGQMFNTVAVDQAGEALTPLLSWLSARATAQAERIEERMSFDAQFERYGTVFTAKDIVPRILWLQDEAPDVWTRTAAVLDCKDYLNARLTGRIATDHAGASAYFLYDVVARRWDEDAARSLGVPPERLPAALAATEALAGLGKEAARAMGIAPGTPVVVSAGDVAAGQVGAGAARPGEAHLSLGTAAYYGITLDRPLRDPGRRLGILCHMDPRRWLLWAEMETGGGALAWWREILGRMTGAERASAEEVDRLAAEVPPGEVDLLFAPWLSGERVPVWDHHARGAFVGLGLHHGPGHLTRAVIEGIAYHLRWVLEYAEAFGVRVGDVRVIGGAGSGRVLPQVIADVLGRPLALVADPQSAGARGAALCALAAIGGGDLDELAAATPLAGTIEPDPYRGELYAPRYAAFRGLHDALARPVRELGARGEA
jgi:xylulokinase